MFGIPNFESPLAYFGVLIITIGVYLTLSGFGILKIEKYTTPEGPKSWGTGFFLLLIGAWILFILSADIEQPRNNTQEVSILKCHNNPDAGIIKSNIPVVLSWGWETDDEIKRDEIISISNFILEIDGENQNLGKVDTVLASSTLVYWKLTINGLPVGIYEVRLVRIFTREFVDSSGTTPAGRVSEEVCELVVK